MSLVHEGKRDPDRVRHALQGIIDDSALTPSLGGVEWTDPKLYHAIIEQRSIERGWPSLDKHFNLNKPHSGNYRLTSVTLSLGQGLDYDFAEAVAWAKDVITRLGFQFDNYLEGLHIHADIFDYSALEAPSVRPAQLDLNAYWDTCVGCSVADSRTTHRQAILEPLWLFCMNPLIWLKMDGRKIPFVSCPGAKLGDRMVLRLEADVLGAYISWTKASKQHTNATVAKLVQE
ncbi:hypothetical protein FACS189431_6300 [Alphaproteobacteria bacterium]|nr:hypothetical protein FACS189431_6300 [Alphaproteobacteria bacterium]